MASIEFNNTNYIKYIEEEMPKINATYERLAEKDTMLAIKVYAIATQRLMVQFAMKCGMTKKEAIAYQNRFRD